MKNFTKNLNELDGFTQSEIIGRTKFSELIKSTETPNLAFTTDKYCQIDAVIKNKEGVYSTVEIKNRDIKYESYPTYMFEKSKYDFMMKCLDTGKFQNGLYVNFFGDTAYVFTLKDINYLVENNLIKLDTKWCPNTTVNTKFYKDKSCYLLPKEYAYQFKKDNETCTWKLTKQKKGFIL